MPEQYPLDEIRVAAPCSASWEEMTGDDRVRFCDQCQLNVYNFSQMTRSEVQALVETTEGRLCGRLYRREDGKLLTRNCPKGLQAVRVKALKVASLFAGAVIGMFATIGLGQASEKIPCVKPVETSPLRGGLVIPPGEPAPVMGDIAYPEPSPQQTVQPAVTPEPDTSVMGEVSVPETSPSPTGDPVMPEHVMMGKIQAPRTP